MFKKVFPYIASAAMLFNFGFSNNNFDVEKGKEIVYNAVVENLEPVYNPCIPSRSKAPENYSKLVEKILFDVADKIGDNNGVAEDSEIFVALQLLFLDAEKVNNAYCPKHNGPAFETTENFEIVKEIYKKYNGKGPVILPWAVRLYLELVYGI